MQASFIGRQGLRRGIQRTEREGIVLFIDNRSPSIVAGHFKHTGHGHAEQMRDNNADNPGMGDDERGDMAGFGNSGKCRHDASGEIGKTLSAGRTVIRHVCAPPPPAAGKCNFYFLPR